MMLVTVGLGPENLLAFLSVSVIAVSGGTVRIHLLRPLTSRIILTHPGRVGGGVVSHD